MTKEELNTIIENYKEHNKGRFVSVQCMLMMLHKEFENYFVQKGLQTSDVYGEYDNQCGEITIKLKYSGYSTTIAKVKVRKTTIKTYEWFYKQNYKIKEVETIYLNDRNDYVTIISELKDRLERSNKKKQDDAIKAKEILEYVKKKYEVDEWNARQLCELASKQY